VKRRQELEGLEALPMQDWNPWEQDATDEDAAVASFPATGAGAGADSAGTAAAAAASGASPQRGRKRPRSPTSSTSVPLGVQRTFATPPSGQWAADAGGGDGSADDFSLSVKRPRTAPPGKCQVRRRTHQTFSLGYVGHPTESGEASLK